MKRTELVVFLCIMAVALGMRIWGVAWSPPGLSPDETINATAGLYVNLQSLSVRVLGNTMFAIRLVSVMAGVLTVLGIYLLARRMFDDWRIAALASFLTAVGFWHVYFSRISVQEIMAPLLAVWGFYYLYKGIETHRLWHFALAGIWFGLGFHTVVAFRIMPAAIACTLIALWLSLRSAFSHRTYLHARHQMLGGIALMVGTMVIVLLPAIGYLYAHPWSFTGRIPAIVSNGVETLGMFFFTPDIDVRHSISGEPLLFWPVSALFAVGLVHTIWRFIHSWRTRGHPGVVQTMLLSWFFVGLIPSFVAADGSSEALRALLVSPTVYMLSAVGLHWLYCAMERWYRSDDHRKAFGMDRSSVAVTIAVLSLLVAIGFGDAHRYFDRPARSVVMHLDPRR